jgi:diamine N-acetyltransferase
MAVEFRPVTRDNWTKLIKLKVRDNQQNFVAPNLYSIAESQFGFEHEGEWKLHPFGLYVEEEPVGFLMYGINHDHSRFQAFIIRLMIDERFQGRGYGKEAMNFLLEQLRANGDLIAVGISYEPDNEIARKLYASLGFVETGEMLDAETLAIATLQ